MKKYLNYFNYSVDVTSFYKNLDSTSFKDIKIEKLSELKETSKKLNRFFNNEDTDITRPTRYVKIMNKIKIIKKRI